MIFKPCRFLGGELSPFAARERFVEREIGKSDSFQIGDLVAYRLEHSLDLMEFALSYADFSGTVGREMDGCGTRGRFFSDVHTLAKKLHVRVGQRAFAFKAISLFNVAFG